MTIINCYDLYFQFSFVHEYFEINLQLATLVVQTKKKYERNLN
jgi:hypothetical protein